LRLKSSHLGQVHQKKDVPVPHILCAIAGKSTKGVKIGDQWKTLAMDTSTFGLHLRSFVNRKLCYKEFRDKLKHALTRT
jgi:hypothetical protein